MNSSCKGNYSVHKDNSDRDMDEGVFPKSTSRPTSANPKSTKRVVKGLSIKELARRKK